MRHTSPSQAAVIAPVICLVGAMAVALQFSGTSIHLRPDPVSIEREVGDSSDASEPIEMTVTVPAVANHGASVRMHVVLKNESTSTLYYGSGRGIELLTLKLTKAGVPQQEHERRADKLIPILGGRMFSSPLTVLGPHEIMEWDFDLTDHFVLETGAYQFHCGLSYLKSDGGPIEETKRMKETGEPPRFYDVDSSPANIVIVDATN